jgi:hypothetical protein
MSRGPGWLQRAVLNILDSEDRYYDTFEITATVYAVKRDKEGNRWVSDAQHASVRRVLTGLAKEGKALKLGTRHGANSRQHWANVRFRGGWNT